MSERIQRFQMPNGLTDRVHAALLVYECHCARCQFLNPLESAGGCREAIGLT